jgi:hypothetical protein
MVEVAAAAAADRDRPQQCANVDASNWSYDGAAVCKLVGNSKPERSAIHHLGQARLAVAVLQLASLSS